MPSLLLSNTLPFVNLPTYATVTLSHFFAARPVPTTVSTYLRPEGVVVAFCRTEVPLVELAVALAGAFVAVWEAAPFVGVGVASSSSPQAAARNAASATRATAQSKRRRRIERG